MESVLVSFSGRPVTDEIMRLCRGEIAALERLYAQTSIWRVTLDEVGREGRGPQYEVHVVVAVPGGELIVRRTPPEDADQETVAEALAAAFGTIQHRLADYWSRHAQADRRPA